MGKISTDWPQKTSSRISILNAVWHSLHDARNKFRLLFCFRFFFFSFFALKFIKADKWKRKPLAENETKRKRNTKRTSAKEKKTNESGWWRTTEMRFKWNHKWRHKWWWRVDALLKIRHRKQANSVNFLTDGGTGCVVWITRIKFQQMSTYFCSLAISQLINSLVTVNRLKNTFKIRSKINGLQFVVLCSKDVISAEKKSWKQLRRCHRRLRKSTKKQTTVKKNTNESQLVTQKTWRCFWTFHSFHFSSPLYFFFCRFSLDSNSFNTIHILVQCVRCTPIRFAQFAVFPLARRVVRFDFSSNPVKTILACGNKIRK